MAPVTMTMTMTMTPAALALEPAALALAPPWDKLCLSLFLRLSGTTKVVLKTSFLLSSIFYTRNFHASLSLVPRVVQSLARRHQSLARRHQSLVRHHQLCSLTHPWPPILFPQL